ncbi:aldo/keto reductase [Deinococcus psychrotolerans]|uniref:Aldo/keto reductase n=1 Tax=Deinococcus psychrotolerans TaxID=2489213 RepID=A0A3G8YBV9_9DEIO|nr:aldo/keto reductase [Deinococcus psychrotolerans]AZI42862.1 aldo/keto reductase [Deinococcus psychrotolerans]
MTQPHSLSAQASGQFKIGGDLSVNRLGYGAMRITGKGIWGEPDDREEALKVLKRLPELGIDFIDTADSYGPYISEDLIAEALFPYGDTVIATKGGLTRHGPDVWPPLGRPEYLRQCVLMSLRRLKIEQIPLWQLHRIDKKVPRDEQFGVMKQMQDEGLIRHLGLSEVSVEEIKAAQQVFEVTTVQNLYNLVTRQSEEVLDYCEAQNIGFIPWFPLASGSLAREGSLLSSVAEKHQVSASGIALAWILQRSPVMLPIPGTSKVKHLEENVAAAGLILSDEDFKALDQQGKAEASKQK